MQHSFHSHSKTLLDTFLRDRQLRSWGPLCVCVCVCVCVLCVCARKTSSGCAYVRVQMHANARIRTCIHTRRVRTHARASTNVQMYIFDSTLSRCHSTGSRRNINRTTGAWDRPQKSPGDKGHRLFQCWFGLSSYLGWRACRLGTKMAELISQGRKCLADTPLGIRCPLCNTCLVGMGWWK